MLVMLSTPGLGAHAATQSVTGTAQLSNILTYGNTAYSVDYSYPAIVSTGSNMTISVSLHVVSLTGLVEYITAYRIVADVFVANQHVLNGTAISGVNAPFLYPGSTWGPNNITIPITPDDTGVAKGTSVNATVSLTLQDTLWYGVPRLTSETEPAMQGGAGSFTIENSVSSSTGSGTGPSSGQAFVPYVLLATGAILMAAAVVLPRGSRKSSP